MHWIFCTKEIVIQRSMLSYWTDHSTSNFCGCGRMRPGHPVWNTSWYDTLNCTSILLIHILRNQRWLFLHYKMVEIPTIWSTPHILLTPPIFLFLIQTSMIITKCSYSFPSHNLMNLVHEPYNKQTPFLLCF